MTVEQRANALADTLIDELGVPDWQRPNVREWVLNAMIAAVGDERKRWAVAVAEVRERAENGVRLTSIPDVAILTRGALSALKGVENLINEGGT